MRGHIAKKGKRYYPVVDVGRDPETGRRKQKWHGSYPTKREAEAVLAEIVRDLRTGSYVTPSRKTVAEFVQNEWLPALRSSELKPGTIALHELNVRAYLLPVLGEKALQDVTPLDLERLYAKLRESGKRDGTGLSRSATVNVHKTTRSIFKKAQKLGLRQGNPAEAIEMKAGKTAEVETWTPKQMHQFLKTVAEDRLFAAWLLAATTGMRRGEILGLRWSDVSLDLGKVSIRSTIVLVKDKPTWSDPKTSKSRRTITLAPEAVAALKAHKVAQAEDKLFLGPAFEDNDLVFCQEDGKVLHPTRFTDAFQRLSREAKVPRRKFHCVRHTFATMALEAGVHPKVVSEILGHSSVSITLDLYTHSVEGLQAEATSKVANLMLGSGR